MAQLQTTALLDRIRDLVGGQAPAMVLTTQFVPSGVAMDVLMLLMFVALPVNSRESGDTKVCW